jgi:formylglycine-generating enzyme required for sulfatase activity
VVTPLPAFGRVADEIGAPVGFKDIWLRNRRAILQSAALIALAALLVAFVFWWISRNRPKSVEEPASLQSATAPPAVAPSQPDQQASPVAQANQTAANPAPEGMVYVPGGQFEMGRTNGDEFERPAHSVTVEPFFMDRTEVTNQEYQRFVTATSRSAPSHWQNGQFPEAEAKLPVVNVSWDDANAYAKWANKRLPTEAEWEFAARGTDGRLYPWGNNWISSASNAGRANSGRIMEVGRFPNGASPFGALDMCGNVWEWTSSTLRSYAQGNQEIAPGKVIRGGAFDVPNDRATTTYRGVLPADKSRDKTGFRTVRSLQ